MASTVQPPPRPISRVELIALPGLPDFEPGDDLAGAIAGAATAHGVSLADGDVVVVAQKVVSKCEGAYATLADAVPSERARELADITGKDPRLVEIVLSQSSEVLRARPGLLIVADKSGHVMANAGVDSSNIEGGEGDDGLPVRVLKLPADPDQSALQLKERLIELSGARIAVVINDSWGRAWRNGTTGHAVGVAGFAALWNRRGEPDMFGRELRVTEIGLADEIAAAASLVMGAAGERQPVVVVRGMTLPAGDGGARRLIRDRSKDLFR